MSIDTKGSNAVDALSVSAMADAFIRTAHAAGQLILSHYNASVDIRTKTDQSPVTVADEEAERLILDRLNLLFPDIPVISEEAAAAGVLPEVKTRFILVDPLDGTKEFLGGNGEFTVNIGLVDEGRPILGVVYAPAIECCYWGELGRGAASARVGRAGRLEGIRWSPIHPTGKRDSGLVAVASRSHRDVQTDEYLKRLDVRETISAGSSLKFCLVAEGSADLYPRFGPTMEWDTAAGHAVLAAAGGSVVCVDGTPLTYGKVADGFTNPFFIARSWA